MKHPLKGLNCKFSDFFANPPLPYPFCCHLNKFITPIHTGIQVLSVLKILKVPKVPKDLRDLKVLKDLNVLKV